MRNLKFEHLKDIEKLGLLIMNIHKMRYLTVMKDAEELIRKRHKSNFTIEGIPINDKETYKLLCDGRIFGVFQKRSKYLRNILRKLKPDVFEDIIALVALYRPGPLGSGMVDDFIGRKHGKVPIKNIVPQLDDILKETYGIMLYQEHVIRIAEVIGGFSIEAADKLIKAMRKKYPKEMAQQREKFVEGAAVKGISQDKADKIFDLMEHFTGWVINKSLGTAYALIVYQSAYIKAHYPLEFLTALIINYAEDIDMVSKCVDEIKEILTAEIRRYKQ